MTASRRAHHAGLGATALVLIALPALLAASALLASCKDAKDEDSQSVRPLPEDDDSDDDTDDFAYTFPDGFLFGVATAGYQVEPGCPTIPPAECADANSDWYQYAASPDTQALARTFLAGEDPAEHGPGEWELYEPDLDLVRDELRGNAFRMSIEWSRVFPEPTDGIEGYAALRDAADPVALAHYHAVLAAVRDRGLTPFVNLNHYTLPAWIHDGVGCTLDLDTCSPRGWLDSERTVGEIAKFAGFVASEFGGQVDLWATLNEPLAVLLPGYLLPTPQRTNPPAAILHTDEFLTVMEALIEAHARMVDTVRANDTDDADSDGVAEKIGLVYAMSPVRPIDPNRALDQQAADNTFYLWNLAFLDGVGLGLWDENLDGTGEPREEWEGRLDFLGINYYLRLAVEGLPFSLLPGFSPLLTLNPVTLVMDERYPRGLYDMATLASERYGVPIYITENNGQYVPEGRLDDESRLMVEHLSWAAKAIEDGVDLRGYFYWSLIDNIEWNQGIEGTYGLYAVDYASPTRTRTTRSTVETFAAVAGPGAIPQDLADQYPVVP